MAGSGRYELRPAWPDDAGAAYLVGPDGVEIVRLPSGPAAALADRVAYLRDNGFPFGAQAILEAFAVGHRVAAAVAAKVEQSAPPNVVQGPWQPDGAA
ncbi:MAG: hypothetical protein RIB84_23805 [Sneathiellaceae bacterium]